mmetsp:Transcript_37703/g.81743  ORF Transcript_37703/g.81743 Transcript_37703/m.81743 type:complete len:210 (-) Transcript_37703:42-671(-)
MPRRHAPRLRRRLHRERQASRSLQKRPGPQHAEHARSGVDVQRRPDLREQVGSRRLVPAAPLPQRVPLCPGVRRRPQHLCRQCHRQRPVRRLRSPLRRCSGGSVVACPRRRCRGRPPDNGTTCRKRLSPQRQGIGVHCHRGHAGSALARHRHRGHRPNTVPRVQLQRGPPGTRRRCGSACCSWRRPLTRHRPTCPWLRHGEVLRRLTRL